MSINRQRIRLELQTIFSEIQNEGRTSIVINSGELHRRIGGYPSRNHRIPSCCAAMRSIMQEGDIILENTLRNDGASFSIEYKLPR